MIQKNVQLTEGIPALTALMTMASRITGTFISPVELAGSISVSPRAALAPSFFRLRSFEAQADNQIEIWGSDQRAVDRAESLLLQAQTRVCLDLPPSRQLHKSLLDIGWGRALFR